MNLKDYYYIKEDDVLYNLSRLIFFDGTVVPVGTAMEVSYISVIEWNFLPNIKYRVELKFTGYEGIFIITTNRVDTNTSLVNRFVELNTFGTLKDLRRLKLKGL